jgi:hypothetical protein
MSGMSKLGLLHMRAGRVGEAHEHPLCSGLVPNGTLSLRKHFSVLNKDHLTGGVRAIG